VLKPNLEKPEYLPVKPPARARVFIACSLDGSIAGPEDDLSWLFDESAEGDSEPGAVAYDAFIRDIGAMLIGRRTHDAVLGFRGPWPYGDLPVFVATSRPLDPPAPTVRAVSGPLDEMLEAAKEAADGKDVYVDGGDLIRQMLDAGLIDDMIVTIAPHILGGGIPLFAGAAARHRLEFTGHYRYGAGMVQLHARVRR
jgi:dihydrofolate reductase